MYEEGRGGLSQDDAQAATWLRKSADQGDAQGEYFLGVLIEKGRGGLTKDTDQAIALYRIAAAQNEPRAKEAMKRLGVEAEPGK